jgi:hypothetical protein
MIRQSLFIYLHNKPIDMKKHFILFALALLAVLAPVRADEGMWLLPLLKQMNINKMQEIGCKLSADEIYDVNHSSIKDAVVIFGGGCTGELISNEGLLVTNHHCGYSSIQKLSSVEHDYLTDGYWAMSRAEELPAPGLSVTFLISMTDVTAEIEKVQQQYAGNQRQLDSAVAMTKRALVDKAVGNNRQYTGEIDSFYADNAYYLIIYEKYTDVRFVGAPPSSIGKFGADTDNWMWPRHTCDFSMFRVYAGKDNNPAPYSPDNVPLKPRKSLTISTKGVQEGDFTFIVGFPGRTNRYMSEAELKEQIMTNDISIKCRGERQAILLDAMQANPKTRIQYANKYANSSNFWKKAIGMNETFRKLNVERRRAQEEQEFVNWYFKDAARKAEYGRALPLIDSAVAARHDAIYLQRYLMESIGNIEIVMPAMYVYQAKGLIAQNPDGIQKIKASTDQNLKNFYKDYDPDLDRKVAKAMMKLYKDNVSAEELPECYNTISASYGGSIDSFIDNVYDKSVFTTLEGAEKALADINAASAATSDDNASSEDPATQLLLEGVSKMSRTMSPAATSQSDFALGKKLFTKGQLEMKQGEPIYPDANFTMRLTYGLVKPYSPKDGVTYDYYTTLDGVMEKEDSTSWEFIVPKKLKQIYAAKNYGRWGLPDGKMPACFIMTGDITGGNSGSPVMNAKGELVGLAFDGNWESMSGDIIFEPQLQRCICVDIRYVMMILEKYGNAGYLLKEMKFD